MKILITGCAGFVGAHLTKRLLKSNHQIVGLDNLNNYYSPKLKIARLDKLIGKNKKFRFIKGDIGNLVLLKKIFSQQKFDLVCHLAAQAGVRYSLRNPFVYQKTNIEGTLNILEMIRHYQNSYLVFASSSSVYGRQKKLPFSETHPCNEPASLYGATKQTSEAMIKVYHYIFGIKATILRLFTVYGPWGRPDMAYYFFTQKILAGKTIEVFEKNTKRDFTYIDDIVRGINLSIRKRPDFEIINLGNSCPVTLTNLTNVLEKLTNKKAKIQIKPLPASDVKITFANIKKAQKLLSWQPKTSLEKGLEKFVSWYKKEGVKLMD